MKLFLREVTNIMFVYIALISRKINIFLNIQSEENVTHVILSDQSEPDILLRFKLHLNSYICRIQWNKVKTIGIFPFKTSILRLISFKYSNTDLDNTFLVI